MAEADTTVGHAVPIQGGAPGAPTPPGTTTGDILYWDGSAWVLLAPGTAGQKLETQGAGSAPQWVDAGSMVMFGASSLATTVQPRFLVPGFASVLAPTRRFLVNIPRAGTLRNLFIEHGAGGTPGGETITYTVRVNSAPTALAVSMAATASTGSNVAANIAVAQGAEVDIRVTKSGALGSSPLNVMASLVLR